jgi:hypothetical protein
MKQSLLKYSAWISLVFLALVSCRSSKILSSGDQAVMISDSISSGSFNKITLKAKVTFQEKELAGLMLIKKTPDGNLKIAFYNELGLTYLEGTFENSSKHKKLIIKNIVPVLNHKPFVKSFEKSMQTVFSDKLKPITQSSNPPITQSSNPPITQSSNPPITQSTNPPGLPASPLSAIAEDILIIQLRNGFRLELKPQH